jgi:hypothetical protein
VVLCVQRGKKFHLDVHDSGPDVRFSAIPYVALCPDGFSDTSGGLALEG